MLIEEIKNIKETKSDLRKFGLTVGIVLLIIGAVLFFTNSPSFVYFILTGVLLVLSGLTYPQILKPLNKIWMAIALMLGWIMTRVILSILFYLMLTAISIIAKIFGKKFLELKIDKTKDTYWIKRDVKKITQTDLERQF